MGQFEREHKYGYEYERSDTSVADTLMWLVQVVARHHDLLVCLVFLRNQACTRQRKNFFIQEGQSVGLLHISARHTR